MLCSVVQYFSLLLYNFLPGLIFSSVCGLRNVLYASVCGRCVSMHFYFLCIHIFLSAMMPQVFGNESPYELMQFYITLTIPTFCIFLQTAM